ncbi:hypothetical protein ACP70R_006626 [Stipagrostis hirtigluma subsp. patula]
MNIKKRSSPLLYLVTAPSVLLLLVLAFMSMDDGAGGHRAAGQVFCRSQFNLANEACSLRPFAAPNPARPLQLQSNGSSAAAYQLQADHHDRDHDRDRGHDHDHDRGHGHGHERLREHSHGRRHDLRHGGGHDPYDTACCRRLMGIDNACICQAMSFLPVFMSRVKHAIKLTPVPGCDVSFECAAVS